MTAFFKRLRLELEDWMRYDPRIRRLACWYKSRRAPKADPNDPQSVGRAITELCAAARLADDPETERLLQERIVALVNQLDASKFDWTEFVPEFRNPRISKAAIVKPYVGPNEKGVLYISFESEWIRLLQIPNYRELAERYSVVISPTSSWPHVLITYVFPAIFPGPIFTLISNVRDQVVFPRMSKNLVVVPLYASSWVNPEMHQPLPKSERIWDLLMVANFAKYKRHQALFAALRTMPTDFRIHLHGQEQDGRTADTIREMASWYGVADRFTISSNKPYDEVMKYFAQARTTAILTKREGSCVVVIESMFADTPAAILQDAEIGSRAYINEHTGRFLDGNHLARDLTEFIRSADNYHPRQWAEQHISCFRSSQILNDALKDHALAHGHAWTLDIAPLHWRPDPRPARVEDRQRLAPEQDEIKSRFGLEIGPPLLQ